MPRGNCNSHLENGHLQMGHFEMGHILKCPVSHVLNFRGWIKLIYDKITLIYCVENEVDPTSEVQNIENGVLQNAPFANAPSANGRFPNGSYSCLWTQILKKIQNLNFISKIFKFQKKIQNLNFILKIFRISFHFKNFRNENQNMKY